MEVEVVSGLAGSPQGHPCGKGKGRVERVPEAAAEGTEEGRRGSSFKSAGSKFKGPVE